MEGRKGKERKGKGREGKGRGGEGRIGGENAVTGMVGRVAMVRNGSNSTQDIAFFRLLLMERYSPLGWHSKDEQVMCLNIPGFDYLMIDFSTNEGAQWHESGKDSDYARGSSPALLQQCFSVLRTRIP